MDEIEEGQNYAKLQAVRFNERIRDMTQQVDQSLMEMNQAKAHNHDLLQEMNVLRTQNTKLNKKLGEFINVNKTLAGQNQKFYE